MNDYRSAYERYYKNINNTARGGKDSNKYLPFGNGNESCFDSRNGGMINNKHGNYLVRRIIRELIGATLLLVIFFGLKFIPFKEVRQAYTVSKQALSQNFNYDKSIDAFSYVKIGDFKVEDLKSEKLKVKVYQCIDYLKNANNAQIKSGS